LANKKGKQTAADQASSLIAGIQKHLVNASMTFGGGTFTTTQVTAELQELVGLRNAVNAARASTKVKVDAETAQAPALRAYMGAFVDFVRVQFGTQADVLADFGIAPKKAPTPLTVEQKAAAAAKRAATRVARGTKSAKAKKGIKGAVTGVVVTPIVAPAPVVQQQAASPAPTGGTTPHSS
jgi:hypothetical protein